MCSTRPRVARATTGTSWPKAERTVDRGEPTGDRGAATATLELCGVDADDRVAIWTDTARRGTLPDAFMTAALVRGARPLLLRGTETSTRLLAGPSESALKVFRESDLVVDLATQPWLYTAANAQTLRAGVPILQVLLKEDDLVRLAPQRETAAEAKRILGDLARRRRFGSPLGAVRTPSSGVENAGLPTRRGSLRNPITSRQHRGVRHHVLPGTWCRRRALRDRRACFPLSQMLPPGRTGPGPRCGRKSGGHRRRTGRASHDSLGGLLGATQTRTTSRTRVLDSTRGPVSQPSPPGCGVASRRDERGVGIQHVPAGRWGCRLKVASRCDPAGRDVPS